MRSVTNSEESRSMLDALRDCFNRASRIDIIVSFVKTSGVLLLEDTLRNVCHRKIPIRIITGTYLGITEPSALYRLKTILKDHGEIYLFNDGHISFHPKAYFFEDENGRSVFVGSSNLSRSALSNAVEWNYQIREAEDPQGYTHFREQFESILAGRSVELDDQALKKYSANWVKPQVDFDASVDQPLSGIAIRYPEENNDNVFKVTRMIRPNDAQIEALYELSKLRAMGSDKALVAAATGVGKTYLAAFDSQEAKRILFIAHREEILGQAERTFRMLRPDHSIGHLMGGDKSWDRNIVFASIQTISREDYVKEIPSNYFDYIVMDEFHHAAADSYQKILNHFKPAFLLGLTATPHRMDNQDIFALCDYNVAYEVDLFGAIEKGWLVPFRYYGIYDYTIDYDQLAVHSGWYKDEELEKVLNVNERAELILKHFTKHRGKRAIAFCVSIDHAERMAAYFVEAGIPAAAVHSKSGNRHEALGALSAGKIEVIFTVDIFNEGVDIPNLEMVMFLRPTESPIIFLQQLGRGLRLSEGKEYLTVLDFIGNHKKLYLLPKIFTGMRERGTARTLKEIGEGRGIPATCFIDFDFRIIDLAGKQDVQMRKFKDRLRDEFNRISRILERIPMRVDMLRMMDEGVYQMMRQMSKENVFRDYLTFLETMDVDTMLSKDSDAPAREFIKVLETTSMSKLYKLPVIRTFFDPKFWLEPSVVEEGELFKLAVMEDELHMSFKSFYEENGQNALDMYQHAGTKNFHNWDKEQYLRRIFTNPVHFLSKSHGDFFTVREREFHLSATLREYTKDVEFVMHVKDILEFRRLEFLKNRLLEEEELMYEKQ